MQFRIEGDVEGYISKYGPFPIRHAALSCFYGSPKWTNQTLTLDFFAFLASTKGEAEVKGIQLFAICNLPARCHLILQTGSLMGDPHTTFRFSE